MITAHKVIEDIRTALERLIDQKLPDRTWNYLVSEGKVAQVASREQNVGWLEQEVVKLDAAGGGILLDGRNNGERLTGEVVKRRRSELIGDRNEALSLLHVAEARKDPEVVAWRRDLLGEKFLMRDQVESWIFDQAAKDVKGPQYLLSDVPYDGDLKFDDSGALELTPALRLRRHSGRLRTAEAYLYYGMPGDVEARSIQVEYRGRLDRLRFLGESLADRFGWGKGEATIFLLTDLIPRFRPIRTSMGARPHLRIALTIDAAVSPREVMDAYKAARQSAQGRVRTLTRKHLTLAVFTMDRPEEEAWSKRMAAWNKSYPSHKYSSEGNFRRDSVAAVKRLRRRPADGIAAVLHSMTKESTAKK